MDKKHHSKNSKPSSLMKDPGKASGSSTYLKRICCISPWARKRAETSAAKEQFFANMTSSTLCKLPVELILMIGNFAADADLLSLSVSCRLFRSILAIESEKRPPLPATERKEFHNRLKKDLFYVMARVESSSPAAKPRKLLCSFCLVKHPKRMFGKDAALESPFTRACRGLKGLLPVCEHRSLTFAEIQGLLSQSEDKTCVRLCNHEGYCPAFMTVSTTPISRSKLFKNWEQGSTWLVHSYSKPFDEGGRRYFSWDEARAMIGRLNFWICPHVRSTSYCFFNLVRNKLDRRGIYGGLLLSDVDNLHLGNCQICHTHIWLKKTRGLYGFCTSRRLGQLSSPLDKRWLAQLVF